MEVEAAELFLSVWGFAIEYTMHPITAGSDIGHQVLTLLWVNLVSLLLELWRRDSKKRQQRALNSKDSFLLAKSAGGVGMGVVGVYLFVYHTTLYHPFSKVSFVYSLLVLLFNLIDFFMPHPAPPPELPHQA